MPFPIAPCRHVWGFPRRWPEFRCRRNADVQTCVKCGARRLSIVQFGPAHQSSQTPAVVESDPVRQEVRL
jgi:NAD-dependent SIR2 family protein deacetylase